MAQQIEQLNKVYARMIEAMTVNMRVAALRVLLNNLMLNNLILGLTPSMP